MTEILIVREAKSEHRLKMAVVGINRGQLIALGKVHYIMGCKVELQKWNMSLMKALEADITSNTLQKQ